MPPREGAPRPGAQNRACAARSVDGEGPPWGGSDAMGCLICGPAAARGGISAPGADTLTLGLVSAGIASIVFRSTSSWPAPAAPDALPPTAAAPPALPRREHRPEVVRDRRGSIDEGLPAGVLL